MDAGQGIEVPMLQRFHDLTEADVADGPSDPLTTIDIDPPITSQSFDFFGLLATSSALKRQVSPVQSSSSKGRSKEPGPSGPSKFLSDVQLPSASSAPSGL